VIQQHQRVEDGVCEYEIEKVTNWSEYLTHEISPAFLDLVGQTFWDWIIKITLVEWVTASNAFDSQPSSTEKAIT
jgi:hypothetical protein